MKTKYIFLLVYIIPFLQLQAQGPKTALTFDGFNDYVFFDFNNRGITNEVTVEAWVKTSSTKLQLVTAKYDREGERGYQLVMREGKAAFSGRDGSGIYRISGYSPRIINDNNWHHLAGVCKNGTWSIYIDGILESKSVTGYSSVNLSSNAPFTVGNYYMVNNDYYQGQVDELKIWKKGLSVEEIRAGMCQAADMNNTDLVAYLKFDEGAGSTLTDYSSYAIHGTFRNMNPSTAWVTSGAPVGDKSIFRYANMWDNSLELVTDIANFSVSRAETGIKGFHLYQIASPPTNAAGMPNMQQIQEYYGLFKVGDPGKKYKILFKQYLLTCGGKLYRRADNSVPTWAAVADTVGSPVIIYHHTANYGEFASVGNLTEPITINGPATFCTGTAVTLSVTTENGTVKWSTGATSKNIQVNKAGTYAVTVTENGCERTGSITVQESTPVTVDLGADRNLCFGEIITLSAPAGMAAYKWSTGATSAAITAATSGNYWVEVTNSAGCVTRDEVKITVIDEPKLQWQSQASVCYGKPVILNATVPGATYLWSNGQTSPSIEVKQAGLYKVRITLNGCTMEREAVIAADECPIIPNIITPNGDGKNDTFVVEGVEPSTFAIEIFNRWGKSIYQSVRYDNGWSAQGVPAGMYFYHFKSSRSQNTFKGWLEVIK